MSRTLRTLIFAVVAVAAFGPPPASEAGGRDGAKLALVIAGAEEAGRQTSAADAGLVAQALAQAGFEVTTVGDADATRLRKAAARFDEAVGKAKDASVFVYIAGKGVQWSGDNFFVPAGAAIAHQVEVPEKAVPLAEISGPIEALPARARVFVYDLARDSDVARSDAMPLTAGLALVRPAVGSLVAINAAPGTVCGADVPPFGRYARALAEALRTPGLSMRAVFERVRLRVAQASGGAVVPWHWSEIDGEVTPLPARGPSVSPPAEDRPIAGLPVEEVFWAAIAEDSLTGYDAFLHTFPEDRLAARIKTLIAARVEALTWSAAVEADTPSAYWTYMLRYPHGAHYVDVRRRLAAIRAALAPPPRFDVFDFAGLRLAPAAPPPLSDGRAVSLDSDWPPVPPVPRDLLPPIDPVLLDLPPPPLFPRGAVPVSLPLPALAANSGRSATPRPIEEMLVPHFGNLSVETVDGGRAMTIAARAKLVSRVTTDEMQAVRLIIQADEADHVQARTRIVRDGRQLTTVQTDSIADVLIRTVAISSDGDRTVTVTNGRDQLVAQTQTDDRGVETVVTLGAGTLPDRILLPADPYAVKPKVRANPQPAGAIENRRAPRDASR